MPNVSDPYRTIYLPAGSKHTKKLKLGDSVELDVKGVVESLSVDHICVRVGSMKYKIKGNSFSSLDENWGGKKEEEAEPSNEMMELLSPTTENFNRGY